MRKPEVKYLSDGTPIYATYVPKKGAYELSTRLPASALKKPQDARRSLQERKKRREAKRARARNVP